MNQLDDWTARVCAALGLDAAAVDQHKLVLDVARDVAHQVLRPGAPVSTYLLGVAVGRGADPATAAAAIQELARRHAAAAAPGGGVDSPPGASPADRD